MHVSVFFLCLLLYGPRTVKPKQNGCEYCILLYETSTLILSYFNKMFKINVSKLGLELKLNLMLISNENDCVSRFTKLVTFDFKRGFHVVQKVLKETWNLAEKIQVNDANRENLLYPKYNWKSLTMNEFHLQSLNFSWDLKVNLAKKVQMESVRVFLRKQLTSHAVMIFCLNFATSSEKNMSS